MESKDTAKYELGQKIFKIDIARVSNVVSHSQGKIYKSRVKTASLYSTLTFKLKTAVSSSEKSTIINVNFKKLLESTHAEIRWAIKCVTSQFSFRLCISINDLFREMFGVENEIMKTCK